MNKNYLIFLSIFLLLSSTKIFSQQITDKTHQNSHKEVVKDTTLLIRDNEEYPYHLPFLGQRVYDKGYSLPLPIGVSVSYVNTTMGMGITDLGVKLAPIDPSMPHFGQNIPQEVVDNLVKGPILESLNDNVTMATAAGFNYRVDTYILPFLNVYGMVTQVNGTTSIGIGNSEGGGFGSTVDFDAFAYGGGFTLSYGYKGWFSSLDINYALSDTELLEEQIAIGTYSVRIGKRIPLNQGKQSVAFYVGAMNRNFTNNNATPGYIHLSEVINDDIDLSQPITGIYDNLTPAQKVIVRNLLGGEPDGSIVNKYVNDMFDNTEVEYTIKKDLLQTWTFQFGFSIELNKHLAVRGEYGIEENNKFLMTGINYRFGL